jgi:membrane protease subunit HflC
MKRFVTVLVIIAIVVIIFFIVGPFFVLKEGEQAVVTRFGEIVRSDTEAGLKFKMPFVDTVNKYPKKVLAWDGAAQIIPTKQPENQFIWVDTTARWRIIDQEQFYQSVATLNTMQSRLDDIIDSTVRSVISQNYLLEAIRNSNDIYNDIVQQMTDAQIVRDEAIVLEEAESYRIAEGKGREALSREAVTLARQAMIGSEGETENRFGIELIDIVIRQIKYSDELRESVYQRMIQERRQIAERIRSFGRGEKENILGKLEQEVKAIESTAYEESESIKGTADAQATQIYAQAYENGEEFFKFWRSIESYKKLLPTFKKTLSTDAEYFNFLYNTEGQ